jgi:hypothetical protein
LQEHSKHAKKFISFEITVLFSQHATTGHSCTEVCVEAVGKDTVSPYPHSRIRAEGNGNLVFERVQESSTRKSRA